jgi:hypothetical protein
MTVGTDADADAAEAARHARAIRFFAAGAAIITAGLYGLIGIGVLRVGEASTAGTPDLFAFGAMLGAVFAVTALLLVRFPSRLVWAGVAVLQVIVILGYFAMAGLRVPAIEINGLLVKAAQAAILGAVAWLLMTGRPSRSRTGVRVRG